MGTILLQRQFRPAFSEQVLATFSLLWLPTFLLALPCLAQSTKPIVPQVVKVAGGSFLMGCTGKQQACYDNEFPVRTVKVGTFYLSKTELTVAEWKVFCAATGRQMPNAPKWGWHDDHPVVNVTWYDAVAYCEWLSAKTGLKWRLPTEAEWEFAARGGNLGSDHIFAGSDELEEVGWFIENTRDSGTRPVKQKKPNELGLYDMSGNVWEWCSDWHGENYYASGEDVSPKGAEAGEYRSMRGGSWSRSRRSARVSNRNGEHPETPRHIIGIRLAR